jgi:beta-phosphoglucomutase-like phosphatase (HAD superfamily)
LSAELTAAPGLIIFDFDGVVADSETISNQSVADYLTSIGHPTSLDEAMQLFLGKHHADTVAAMEQYIGRRLPEDFETRHRDRVRVKMRCEVMPVRGIEAFLDAHAHRPHSGLVALGVFLQKDFARNVLGAQPRVDVFLAGGLGIGRVHGFPMVE